MRHADSRREETAVIAKAASTLLYDTAVWYLVWVRRRVGVLCGGMSDAMGSKIRCKTSSTEFFNWQIQSKKSSFSTGSASRNSQSKNLSRLTVKKSPICASVEKGRFRLTNPTV